MCFLCNVFTEEFLLEDMSKYKYLTHGAVSVQGVDDSIEYQSLLESMAIMGFTPDDQGGEMSPTQPITLFPLVGSRF